MPPSGYETGRTPGTGAPLEPLPVTPNAMIATFVRLDRAGAALGLVFVAVTNALTYRADGLWIIPVVLGLQVLALTRALVAVEGGRRTAALALVIGANWLVALVVPIALPFLWPIMVLVVIMPLVLAAPHLDRAALATAIVVAALSAGSVALIGLGGEDGGAVPDISSAIEFAVVVGALSAMTVPIALVVWQTNRLARVALDGAQQLNTRLSESQRRLAASRRRVVEAGDKARSGLERDLHDGAQQRLVALRMQLTVLAATAPSADRVAALNGLIGEIDTVVDELRLLARGIFPQVLATHGLGEAVAVVARNLPGDVRIDVAPGLGRFDEQIERAGYFIAVEAITNAAKHAPEATISVALRCEGDELLVSITDDGPGFTPPVGGATSGLDNMADRVEAVGGTLEICSTPSAGTTVRARIPRVARRDPETYMPALAQGEAGLPQRREAMGG